jgi:tetratricopeptide (TPR) repeat protein
MGYKLGEGLWYGNLGECYALQEKYEQALPYFQQAITHLRDLGAKYNLPWVLVGQGRTLLALQKLAEAAELGREAAELAEQVNRPDKLFLARLLLAQIAVARGDKAAGVEQLHQLLQQATQRPEQAAEVYFCLWQAEREEQYQQEALRLYELAVAQNPCYEFQRVLERLRQES